MMTEEEAEGSVLVNRFRVLETTIDQRESADQQRQHGGYNRSTNMVIDLAELLSLVKMCDQKNGSDRSEKINNNDDVDELSASDDSEPEEGLLTAPFDPDLDDDDDDVDGGEVPISAPAVGLGALNAFSLKGGSSAFSDRSHSIFECLDSVSRLASSSSSSLSQEKATDGVFARPLPPPPSRKTSHPPSSSPTPAKKRGVPDYLVHPERWTHYSLEDVEETSDQGNSRAAHHFLSSLQQRKEPQESRSDSSCDMGQKMIFSKPSRPLKGPPADQPSAVRGKEKETRLSHLEEEDEREVGREKEQAGERRTDQNVEKAEDRARDADKVMRGDVGQPEEEKRMQREKDEEEEKIEELNPTFTSFKKSKRKNYRKSSGQDEN